MRSAPGDGFSPERCQKFFRRAQIFAVGRCKLVHTHVIDQASEEIRVRSLPLGRTSLVGWLLKTPVRAEVGSRLQFARYSDGKALFIGRVIRPVHCEPDNEIGRSCIAMKNVGSFRDCPVAEVPVITECRYAVRGGLSREGYRLPNLRLRRDSRCDSWGGLGDGSVHQLDYHRRLWRLILKPDRATFECKGGA